MNPKEVIQECQDDWHLSWAELLMKYGPSQDEDMYKPYRTCPTCGKKRIYGD